MTTKRRSSRLNKGELFRYLGYEPHPGQVLVHESEASRRVLACGVRWGKSTCAAMEAVAAMMEPRDHSMGWVVGPNYSLTEMILRQVEKVIRGKLAHRIIEVSKREHRFVIRNLGGGLSEVRAKSADNPASLLGEGLNWLVLDEAARVKQEVWESGLSQRLVDRKGWALLISTPRGRDWFWALHRKGQQERYPGIEGWASPSSDNPHLDADVIEAERDRLPEDAFAQEYQAEFLGTGDEPCGSCGWPDENVWGGVVLEDGEGKFWLCDECEGWVDGDGHTVMGRDVDGSRHLKVIDLRSGDALPASPQGCPT